MALIGFESFDAGTTGNTTDLSTLNNTPSGTFWLASASNINKTGGLYSSGCLWFPGTTSNAQFWYPSNSNTLYIGFRFKQDLYTTNAVIMQIYDQTASTVNAGISINASNQLFVFRSTPTTATLCTGGTVIIGGIWYYVELGITWGTGTSGSVTMRLNGNLEAQNTATNNQAGQANSVVLIAAFNHAGQNNYLDDFYMCDSTGSAPFNTFLGPVVVDTVFPTSSNNVTFTPLSGINVAQIQETVVDNDATYNFTSGHGNVDVFNHGVMGMYPATIFATKVQTRARKDDIPPLTGKTQLVSGATTVSGNNSFNLQTIYQEWWDMYTTDPNTGVAWANNAAVNNTTIGYKLV